MCSMLNNSLVEVFFGELLDSFDLFVANFRGILNTVVFVVGIDKFLA